MARHVFVFVSFAFLTACRAGPSEDLVNDPPAPPGPQSEKAFAVDASPTPVLRADSSITGDELRDLNAWTTIATTTLASPRFKSNMTELEKSFPSIWLSAGSGSMSPTQLHGLITAASGNFRYLPTRQIWRTRLQHKISVGSDPAAGNRTALLHIGKLHLERYRAENRVEHSCAVNSLAHEIMHTISASPTKFQYAVTDTGSGRNGAGSKPFASYFVGTVAQCTYLQEIGRVDDAGLRACVGTFGAQVFHGKRCNRFKDGEPIAWPKPRPGRRSG